MRWMSFATRKTERSLLVASLVAVMSLSLWLGPPVTPLGASSWPAPPPPPVRAAAAPWAATTSAAAAASSRAPAGGTVSTQSCPYIYGPYGTAHLYCADALSVPPRDRPITLHFVASTPRAGAVSIAVSRGQFIGGTGDFAPLSFPVAEVSLPAIVGGSELHWVSTTAGSATVTVSTRSGGRTHVESVTSFTFGYSWRGRPAFIAVGDWHSCALTRAGGVQCWGNNRHGQLGDGTTISRSTPVDVTGLASGVIKISAGPASTCALTREHGVKCWGDNRHGQLGDGTTISRSSPVNVVGLASGVDAIAVGGLLACAVVRVGPVRCWGTLPTGETAVLRTTPTDVPGLGGAAISAGYDYVCAVGDRAMCWGANDHGQLGDGTRIARAFPVQVLGHPNGAFAIHAGSRHTCALAWNGQRDVWPNREMKCWGANDYGQLGDGSTADRTVPVTVAGLEGVAVVGMAVGGDHTCAETEAGVRCWGSNRRGQLGNDTISSSRVPVPVTGLPAHGLAVDAGPSGEHTCALVGDGAMCWGRNDSGQLGDGTMIASSVPVEVDLQIHPTLGLRSSITGGVVDPGTAGTFTATVMPLDLEGARPIVRFVVLRQGDDGTWRSTGSRDVVADARGVARLRWTFAIPGNRLVRARVLPDAAYWPGRGIETFPLVVR